MAQLCRVGTATSEKDMLASCLSALSLLWVVIDDAVIDHRCCCSLSSCKYKYTQAASCVSMAHTHRAVWAMQGCQRPAPPPRPPLAPPPPSYSVSMLATYDSALYPGPRSRTTRRIHGAGTHSAGVARPLPPCVGS